MTDWVIKSPACIGYQPLDTVQTTQSTAHRMGEIVDAVDLDDDGKAARFMYVQANGAVSQYQWVAIDEDSQAVAGTGTLANAMHRFGIAQVAFANDEYGWVAIEGSGLTATFDGTMSADVDNIWTSGTAGSLSATTSGAKLSGITLVTAVSTTGQTSTVLMTYPTFVGSTN